MSRFSLIPLIAVVAVAACGNKTDQPTATQLAAQDRAAQSNARNALTAEKTYYVDNQAYGSDATLTAANIEPSLTYVPGLTAAQGSKEVGIVVADNGTVVGAIVCVTSVSAN